MAFATEGWPGTTGKEGAADRVLESVCDACASGSRLRLLQKCPLQNPCLSEKTELPPQRCNHCALHLCHDLARTPRPHGSVRRGVSIVDAHQWQGMWMMLATGTRITIGEASGWSRREKLKMPSSAAASCTAEQMLDSSRLVHASRLQRPSRCASQKLHATCVAVRACFRAITCRCRCRS